MSITEDTRRESYEKLDNSTIYKRIIEILKENKPLSAKEISVVMYQRHYIPFPVRQAVAPRLTELESAGIVEACGKKYDKDTERNVTAYKLVEQ